MIRSHGIERRGGIRTMIRVLQFGMSSNYGGIEAFIMNYYRAIDRTKIQFDFIKASSNGKIAYEDEILSLGGRIYIEPSESLKNGYFALRKAWQEFYRNIDVDEIHYNTVALTNLHAIRFAKEMGLHVYVHAHPSTYDASFSKLSKLRMRLNRRIVHKYADTLLACSSEAGKWMFDSGYKVIPNSIDFNKFSFNQDIRNRIRRELGLDNSFVMLNVGRISIVKNQMFLVDVLHEVRKGRKNAKLVLVGADVLDGAVQRRAKDMGLEGDVVFAGMVQNPEFYYSMSDIFVFPSISEGFGIAPIEAQANGLRCIVSDSLVKAIDPAGTLRYLPIKACGEKKAEKIWADEIIRDNRRLCDDEVDAVREVYDINLTVKTLESIYAKYE